jgi:hypothetical protein
VKDLVGAPCWGGGRSALYLHLKPCIYWMPKAICSRQASSVEMNPKWPRKRKSNCTRSQHEYDKNGASTVSFSMLPYFDPRHTRTIS